MQGRSSAADQLPALILLIEVAKLKMQICRASSCDSQRRLLIIVRT